jgi:hypothetical protein
LIGNGAGYLVMCSSMQREAQVPAVCVPFLGKDW